MPLKATAEEMEEQIQEAYIKLLETEEEGRLIITRPF
jgi:hypothetical protein